MTPKEKAIEIFDKYFLLHESGTDENGVWFISALNKGLAKKYALIAIEFSREFITGDLSESFDKTMYLFEVKQEIEKL
jgi:hypothetical protein